MKLRSSKFIINIENFPIDIQKNIYKYLNIVECVNLSLANPRLGIVIGYENDFNKNLFNLTIQLKLLKLQKSKGNITKNKLKIESLICKFIHLKYYDNFNYIMIKQIQIICHLLNLGFNVTYLQKNPNYSYFTDCYYMSKINKKTGKRNFLDIRRKYKNIISYFEIEKNKIRMIKLLWPDGRLIYFNGSSGNEYKSKEIFPNGNIIYYTGIKGHETVIN